MGTEVLGGKEPSSMNAVAGFNLELSVNFELEEKCSLLKTGFPPFPFYLPLRLLPSQAGKVDYAGESH